MTIVFSGSPVANVELSDSFNKWRLTTNKILNDAASLTANNTFAGTLTGDGSSLANHFTVTNSGAGAYVVNGTGTFGNSNPTLYLNRGELYKFDVNATGHPFYINTANTTGNTSQYTVGITGNGTEVGVVSFRVPMEAPSRLHYNCGNHSTMGGPIIVGSGLDFNVGANSLSVDSLTVGSLFDSSNRRLTIRDEANTIVWGG